MPEADTNNAIYSRVFTPPIWFFSKPGNWPTELSKKTDLSYLEIFGASMIQFDDLVKDFYPQDTRCQKDAKSLNAGERLLACSMEANLRHMISNCAHQIFIPAFHSDSGKSWKSPKRLKSLLSPTVRKKVVFIDRRSSIWHNTQEYLQPIFECVEENNHNVDFLAWYLYCLTLATKNKCELPFCLDHFFATIEEIRYKYKLSQEANARLSNIEGVINMFSVKDTISSLRILPKIDRFSVTERIDEILGDAYLLEASHLRRFFGLSANKAAIKRDIAKIIKFIVKNRIWAKGLLAVTSQNLTTVTSNFGALERLAEIIPSIQSHSSATVLLPGREMECYKENINVHVLIRNKSGWRSYFVCPNRDYEN
jgi:hypothetical protein